MNERNTFYWNNRWQSFGLGLVVDFEDSFHMGFILGPFNFGFDLFHKKPSIE